MVLGAGGFLVAQLVLICLPPNHCPPICWMAFSASCDKKRPGDVRAETFSVSGQCEQEQEVCADPFVKEGHKAVAFGFPRRHVFDHTGVSVDRHTGIKLRS